MPKLMRIKVESDAAPTISSAAQSSIVSDDASSIWDSQSVRISSSDAPSSTGNIIFNVSRDAVCRASTATATDTQTRTPGDSTISAQQQTDCQWDDASSSSSHIAAEANSAPDTNTHRGATRQKTTFMCGFCGEEGIRKTCTRKNDLKRHIEDFHNTNAQWHCKHRGCGMVFDWQAAYKTHLRETHGGSRISPDESKVDLCPQVVFACGFEKCTMVYEAQGDDDAALMFKEYVSHVVKHFDEGSEAGEWSYSTRMRNLLCQSQVVGAWNQAAAGNRGAASSNLHPSLLRWDPQTSVVLRKRLECRHIGDVNLLVQYAMALGSEPNAPLEFRQDIVTPIADTCQYDMPGHRTTATHSQLAAVMAAEVMPSSFFFHRPCGLNSRLAQYMAYQRKPYPREHRAMRRLQQRQARSPLDPLARHHYYHQQDQLVPSHHPYRPPTGNGPGHSFGNLAGVPQEKLASLYFHNYVHSRPNPYHPAGTVMADDIGGLRHVNGREPADVEMKDPSANPSPACGNSHGSL
ncbi:hypothetical protein ACRALDRAFT_1080569 [Sodiomyces alcalophilus JCM 7366]|uniref:uncharacterized protein n=1 Tax=Sodiomyces alcalophilus JCM 7366 TaxID=591952 RepID=UPI0039B3A5D2